MAPPWKKRWRGRPPGTPTNILWPRSLAHPEDFTAKLAETAKKSQVPPCRGAARQRSVGRLNPSYAPGFQGIRDLPLRASRPLRLNGNVWAHVKRVGGMNHARERPGSEQVACPTRFERVTFGSAGRTPWRRYTEIGGLPRGFSFASWLAEDRGGSYRPAAGQIFGHVHHQAPAGTLLQHCGRLSAFDPRIERSGAGGHLCGPPRRSARSLCAPEPQGCLDGPPPHAVPSPVVAGADPHLHGRPFPATRSTGSPTGPCVSRVTPSGTAL